MPTKAAGARMPVFRDRFNLLRGDRTQAEFAAALGMSRATVAFYCAGDRIPDALTLRDIAEKCDVSTDWLLGLTDAKNRDATVQTLCYKTGLSEDAVHCLRGLAQNRNEGYELEFIDYLLTEDEGLLFWLSEYKGAQKAMDVITHFDGTGVSPYDNLKAIINDETQCYTDRVQARYLVAVLFAFSTGLSENSRYKLYQSDLKSSGISTDEFRFDALPEIYRAKAETSLSHLLDKICFDTRSQSSIANDSNTSEGGDKSCPTTKQPAPPAAEAPSGSAQTDDGKQG